MLRIEDMTCRYGAVVATREVSLHVDAGEIVTLIGANGAGKSSTLGAISGFVRYTGHIQLDDRPLPRSAAAVVRAGVVQVPEGRRVFPELTVTENLLMGAHTRRDRAGVRRDLETNMQLFPALAERRDGLAGHLSGGQQQMLAMARGLMAKPRLLMLDEPSLGLAPSIVRDLMDHIAWVNRELGVTILLVEQSVGVALRLAHRGYVLERGRVFLAGTGDELARNDLIRRAYLGEHTRNGHGS
jgi:branched-chain amino acid transport system ATP-binding protein